MAFPRHVHDCSAALRWPNLSVAILPDYNTPVPLLHSSASALIRSQRWRTVYSPSAARPRLNVPSCDCPKWWTLHCPSRPYQRLKFSVALPLLSVAKYGGPSMALLRHVRGFIAALRWPNMSDATLPDYGTPVPLLLSSASALISGQRLRTVYSPTAARERL